MAILHLRRAQAEELPLGNDRKTETNERVRQRGGHSHGLCTQQYHAQSILNFPLHRYPRASSRSEQSREHHQELGSLTTPSSHQGQEVKEMKEIQQTNFQHISPMSISRLIMEIMKLRLHRENIFPGSGCSEWIGSTDPVDRMSPRPAQQGSRSIHLE